MFPEWITDILKAQGLSGAVILGLATGLVYAVRLYIKSNDSRLTDRDTAMKSMADGAAASKEMARVIDERNKATDALADAVDSQSNAMQRLTDKIEYQSSIFQEKLKDNAQAVGSLAESNRVLTGVVTEVRNNQLRRRGS